jgi:hypothetical protein
MLITTAKVNNGVIQIDSKDLPDGTTVTLLAQEGDETFGLDAAQESELLAARTPTDIFSALANRRPKEALQTDERRA